ncbi:MAG: hypothetical protein AAF740_14490, partial [Bacteroidota bacterium]
MFEIKAYQIRFILVTLGCILMTEITIAMRDEVVIGDDAFFWILFVICSTIWFWSLQADTKDYFQTQNPRRLSTLICGLCFMTLIFFIRKENQKPFEKENLLKVVHRENVWNSYTIYFKMDST